MSLVRITSKVNHDYMKVWQQFMWLLDNETGDVQFVLHNGYPTLYKKENFDIETLTWFFGENVFLCDFWQNIEE